MLNMRSPELISHTVHSLIQVSPHSLNLSSSSTSIKAQIANARLVDLAIHGHIITIPAGFTVPRFGVITPHIPPVPIAPVFNPADFAAPTLYVPNLLEEFDEIVRTMCPDLINPEMEDWPWSVPSTDAVREEYFNKVTAAMDTQLAEARARANALIAANTVNSYAAADYAHTAVCTGCLPRANIVVPVMDMGLTMDSGEESEGSEEEMDDEEFDREMLEQDALTMQEQMDLMDIGYDGGDEKMDVEN